MSRLDAGADDRRASQSRRDSSICARAREHEEPRESGIHPDVAVFVPLFFEGRETRERAGASLSQRDAAEVLFNDGGIDTFNYERPWNPRGGSIP